MELQLLARLLRRAQREGALGELARQTGVDQVHAFVMRGGHWRAACGRNARSISEDPQWRALLDDCIEAGMVHARLPTSIDGQPAEATAIPDSERSAAFLLIGPAPQPATLAQLQQWIDVLAPKLADEPGPSADESDGAAGERRAQFMAWLSHELRNPLSAIQNAADLIELHLPSASTPAEKACRTIRHQVERMSRLLDELAAMGAGSASAGSLSPHQDASDPAASHGAGKRSKRVLLVDDNADAVETLKIIFEHEGHQVRTASDGARALEIAAGFLPEVVCLDIGLPGMDGHELARMLRQVPGLQDARLVAVSGQGCASEPQAAGSAFDHYLVKPVDARALSELVASV